MALLNVRLDDDDVRKAAALRDAGVTISTLVRNAIRNEFERHIATKSKVRPSVIVSQILADLPDPTGLPARGYVITNRREVQRRIAAQLKRRR